MASSRQNGQFYVVEAKRFQYATKYYLYCIADMTKVGGKHQGFRLKYTFDNNLS